MLKATKNCDLDKISKILYEGIGHEIISLDELNAIIVKFFIFGIRIRIKQTTNY